MTLEITRCAPYKAMEACKGSGFDVSDHFGEVTEMVHIGSGAQRSFLSYELSRYACYLIVMNGEWSKEVIAAGQTYFAVKTRQHELIDDYERLTEEQNRGMEYGHLREETRTA